MSAFVASIKQEVPPAVNEVGESDRRGLMLSDRKVSNVLGITVVRSGTDWEKTQVNNGGPVDPGSRFRKRFLTTKVAPFLGKAVRGKVSGTEGQKVVLSPKRDSSRMLRRHTISCESGRNLVFPSAPSSPESTLETISPTAQTFAELPQENGRGGCDLGLGSDAAADTVSETDTLVELGIAPLSAPGSCPPSPINPPSPLQTYGVPVSPTARRNPVLRTRREMVRSANKSVQILGIEARQAILKKAEKENEGRIGWSGV